MESYRKRVRAVLAAFANRRIGHRNTKEVTLFIFAEALRERRRDWRVTTTFCGVLASALAILAVCVSVAWPLLWGPLPFPNDGRVVAIQSLRKGSMEGVSWGDSADLRERVPSIEKVAVYSTRTWGVQAERQGHVEVLLSGMVTGEFFDVLGVRPAFGSDMTREHERAGAQNEVWLVNDVAARLFGAPQAAVHKTLWINDASYRVAGVMPTSFRFPSAQGTLDFFIPLSRDEYCCARGGGGQQAVALLRHSRGFETELQVASRALAHDFPATNADRSFVAADMRERLFGPRIQALQWILAGALCLTIIAAANGTGVWMARYLQVRRDLAIRLSLGASMARLGAVRAIEGAIAGLAAGAIAVVLADALLRVLYAIPFLRDRLEAFAVQPPILLAPITLPFAVLTGLAIGMATTVLPHLAVMRRLGESTREAMSTRPASNRFRVLLTALQLAMTAILSWTTIAIAENVYTLLTAERGFETEQTLIAGVGIPEVRYDSDEKMIAFHEAAIRELQAIPGVAAAAGGVNVPQGSLRTRFLRDGQTLPRDRQPVARIGIISPDLLPLLRIPLRRGRGLTHSDRLGSERVALVNEAFVRTHLADAGDPLNEGLRVSFYNGFSMKPYTRFQIAGVVADTRNDGLLAEPQPQIFLPAAQVPMEGFFYLVKTPRAAASIQAELREAIWRVDPAIQRVDFHPLDDSIEQGLAERRALGGFGLVVLMGAGAIVAAGLFASLSASVLESTNELAVRAALGATPMHLALESLRWALAAAAIACLLTALAVPIITSNVQLEKGVLAPSTRNVSLCLLTMVALTVAAAFRPVRRAASLSPAIALRTQ